MRRVSYKRIIEEVSNMVVDTAYSLPEEVKRYIRKAYRAETGLGKKYLGIILKNLVVAAKDKLPLCQDTGLAIFFVEQGFNVLIEAGRYNTLEEIINEGLKEGSKKGFLRSSVVSPIERKNTGTNTPGVVHILSGEKNMFKISLLTKGFGAENTSRLGMLNPSAGKQGIEEFILKTIKEAGSLPCPPIFVGVGIGGSFEKAAILSKMALCKIGENSVNRNWEKSILKKINSRLKIGPGGFGGRTTALDVRIETFPTHIAGLPVAVNISCWAHRFGTTTL